MPPHLEALMGYGALIGLAPTTMAAAPLKPLYSFFLKGSPLFAFQ